MSQQQDDLWRDVSVVLKHSRFIIALLLISVAAAIVSGLATQTEYKAVSQAELDIKVGSPLSGRGDATPTLDTYADLAASDDVFAAAAETLDMDAEAVSRNVTITATEKDPRIKSSLDRLTITATGDSRQQAKARSSPAPESRGRG